MAKAREIKGRIKAVGNIQRITNTMQLIATARFQAASSRTTASKPYAQKIGELVGELSAAGGSAASHPLLHAPAEAKGKRLMLLLTSDRGLCGAYNAQLLRTAVAEFAKRREQDVSIDVEVVGKKGKAYMDFNGLAVHRYHSQFGDKPEYADVEALADEYMKLFLDGAYDGIDVLYMAFESMAKQAPKMMTLLPMEKMDAAEQAEQEQAQGGEVDYDFSPEPQELLEELLPITVKIRLFQAFNEAIISEQIARMVAMKAATDAAKKMGKELGRIYNRARQTAITTELNEIIGGAAAVE